MLLGRLGRFWYPFWLTNWVLSYFVKDEGDEKKENNKKRSTTGQGRVLFVMLGRFRIRTLGGWNWLIRSVWGHGMNVCRFLYCSFGQWTRAALMVNATCVLSWCHSAQFRMSREQHDNIHILLCTSEHILPRLYCYDRRVPNSTLSISTAVRELDEIVLESWPKVSNELPSSPPKFPTVKKLFSSSVVYLLPFDEATIEVNTIEGNVAPLCPWFPKTVLIVRSFESFVERRFNWRREIMIEVKIWLKLQQKINVVASWAEQSR